MGKVKLKTVAARAKVKECLDQRSPPLQMAQDILPLENSDNSDSSLCSGNLNAMVEAF